MIERSRPGRVASIILDAIHDNVATKADILESQLNSQSQKNSGWVGATMAMGPINGGSPASLVLT